MPKTREDEQSDEYETEDESDYDGDSGADSASEEDVEEEESVVLEEEEEDDDDWISLLPIGPCEHFKKPASGAPCLDELFPIPLEQFYRMYILDVGFWHEVCSASGCKGLSLLTSLSLDLSLSLS